MTQSEVGPRDVLVHTYVLSEKYKYCTSSDMAAQNSRALGGACEVVQNEWGYMEQNHKNAKFMGYILGQFVSCVQYSM